MLRELLGLSTPRPRAGIDSLLVIGRQQVRWLGAGHAGLHVIAEGDGAGPSGHAVAAAMGQATTLQKGQRLFVVIGAAEYRVAHETLPRTSRRERRFMLQARLAERREEAGLCTADAEPAAGRGGNEYRLASVTGWPALDEWLGWLAQRPCELVGPLLGGSLVADAAYPARAGNAGCRVALLRSECGGAWLLASTAGRLRLVRFLDASICGGDDARARAGALELQVLRTRDWLIDGGHLTEGVAARVDLIDTPEVIERLREAAGLEVSEGALGDLCRSGRVSLDDPAGPLDAVLWAALLRGHRGSLPAVDAWEDRRQKAARARGWVMASTALAATAAGGACVQASLTWQAWRQLDQLRTSWSQVEPDLQADRQRREAREKELKALAGGGDPLAFENQARAFRALVGPVDQAAELTQLLGATADALARSSVALQRLRLSRESDRASTAMEVAVALPRQVERAAALGEVRHVAGMLEADLPKHRISAAGLEALEPEPAKRAAGAGSARAWPSPAASAALAAPVSGDTLFTLMAHPKK